MEQVATPPSEALETGNQRRNSSRSLVKLQPQSQSQPQPQPQPQPRDVGMNSTEDEEGNKELAAIMRASPIGHDYNATPIDLCSRVERFDPPTRPSSTPFPHPDGRNKNLQLHSVMQYSRSFDCSTGNSVDGADATSVPDIDHDHSGDVSVETATAPRVVSLMSLPVEIHESILDYVFGLRKSYSSIFASKNRARNLSTMLRHCRRREVSQLACVNHLYRSLVQQRLFRHIKIKASRSELLAATRLFQRHAHLCAHVQHVEIWFPVFDDRAMTVKNSIYRRRVNIPGGEAVMLRAGAYMSLNYSLPTTNVSLAQVFSFIGTVFPAAEIVTLEGGERRKSPQVTLLAGDGSTSLPTLPSVKILVIRNQWNIIRRQEDYELIVEALPNLTEWDGYYYKGKSKSYLTMALILQQLPPSLTRLDLCLEPTYGREASIPSYYCKVLASNVHLCTMLDVASQTLEHLSYTGRACEELFTTMSKVTRAETRLRSVKVTVNNCCRGLGDAADAGSGIHEINFMYEFELLVIAAVKSLKKLKHLESLRIEFIDLDSPFPGLNPFFDLTDGVCSGVWNDQIVKLMGEVRPKARFIPFSSNFEGVGYVNGDDCFVIVPGLAKKRVMSQNLSMYCMLEGAR